MKKILQIKKRQMLLCKQLMFASFILYFYAFSAFAQTNFIEIQEVISPGGIKAWLVYDNRLPIISMRFAFRGGAEQDPGDKQGLAEITASLLTQGAGPYDAEAFQQRLADNSIQLSLSAGRDAIKGSLKTLRSTSAEAFTLLRLALMAPRFDQEAIERMQSRQLAVVRFEISSSEWQARYALFRNIFHGHPYSMRRNGTTKTLQKLTREDIANFAAKHFARDNLVIAVTGDILPEELAKRLDEIFGNLPDHASLKSVPEVVWPAQTANILVKREGTQTDMLFALPMLKRKDPDWYAAEIVNYILGGGGFSSRLMQKVRESGGLTYGIGTTLASMDHASLLIGQASTDNPKTGEAWKSIGEVWRDLYENGVTDDEIDAAKDYLTGSLPLTLTNTSAIATVLLELQLDNLELDYLNRWNALVRQVKKEEVHRVIRQWFNPEKLNRVFVGEPTGVTPTRVLELVKE